MKVVVKAVVQAADKNAAVQIAEKEVAVKVQIKVDCNARLGSKKRITLRRVHYKHCNVKRYNSGSILLKPRKLAIPKEISLMTLKMMDKSINNFNSGKVSEPIDLLEF